MSIKNLGVLPLMLVMSASVVAPVTAEGEGRVWIVSVRKLGLGRNERVRAFRVQATGGWIESIPRIPVDWNLEVDNSSGWQGVLSAVAAHGAGALGDEIFFNRFVRVGEAPPVHGLNLPALDVQIEVDVVAVPDLDNKVRTIKLGTKELVLQETQEQQSVAR